MVCEPNLNEEEEEFAFQKSNQELIQCQDQIIVADPNYVEYIRDGVRCYVSRTLRKELYLTDGVLYKKPQKSGKFKRKYFDTFVGIDFKRQIIRLKRYDAEEARKEDVGLIAKK